jgi:hypothetical protein
MSTAFPLSPYARSFVLSQEQLRRYEQDGYVIVRNSLPQQTVEQLEALADDVARLADAPPAPPPPPPAADSKAGAEQVLVHHELAVDQDLGVVQAERRLLCRVENFCQRLPMWDALSRGLFKDLAAQVFSRGQSGAESAGDASDPCRFLAPKAVLFLVHQLLSPAPLNLEELPR